MLGLAHPTDSMSHVADVVGRLLGRVDVMYGWIAYTITGAMRPVMYIYIYIERERDTYTYTYIYI